MLVGDIIRLNARHRGGDEALLMGTTRLTYREMNRRINAVAAALSACGIERGDRVAALANNSIEYVLLYYAVAKLGAMLVPLNVWHRAAEHEYAIADATPKALFVAPDYAALADAATSGVQLQRFGLPGDEGDERDDGGWQELLAHSWTDEEPTGVVEPSDPHMILYTSGTTGKPKGALLSHERTVSDAFGMASALRIASHDTFINYFPPFHVGNWDHMKLFHLVGAKVILLPRFSADEVLEVVPREQVSVLLGVPTMLHELIEHPAFDPQRLASIRLIYYGAYDPSGIMSRTAEAFGLEDGSVEMAHTYGLTEGGPFVTLCPSSNLLEHWGSIGRPVPGVEIVLVDGEGKEVGPDEPGEICVRGPRMSGYWNNPDATAEALAGGWLHTGDVAIADAEGFLRIVDRKKDVIRSGGQNVYSKQVEDCLHLHPVVRDVAVIGLPDPVYEERVCAVVVLDDPSSASPDLADALSGHVRSQLAGYNTPKEVRFVDELPKNAVGKTMKHVLREQLGSMFDAEAHHPPGATMPLPTRATEVRAMEAGSTQPPSIETLRHDGGIVELAFDSARRGNALSAEIVGRLLAAIEGVAATADTRTLLLRGRRRSFSIGADLQAMTTMTEEQFREYVADEYRLFAAIEALPFVTIAVLNGPVIGNAAEMAIACDFRVAGADVRLGFPEVRAGVFGPSGRLSNHVGIGVARDLLLTGRVLDAQEALQHGLVSRVADDPLEDARTLAAELGATAPLSIRLTKDHLNHAYGVPTFDAQQHERSASDTLFATHDAREGLLAARDGRAARFEGR